jgi:hypothetical protein
MADLITQLAARTLQLTPVVQPRIDSVFAPSQPSVDWQSDSPAAGGSRQVISETTPAASAEKIDRGPHQSSDSALPAPRGSAPPPLLVSPASAALPIAYIPRPLGLPSPSAGMASVGNPEAVQDPPNPIDSPTIGPIEPTRLSPAATPESTSESPPASLAAPFPGEDLGLSPSLGIEPIENLPASVALPLSSPRLSAATGSATDSVSVPNSVSNSEPRAGLEPPLTSPATPPPATPLTGSQAISAASLPPPSAPSVPQLEPTHDASPTVPPIVTPRPSVMTSIAQIPREEEASQSERDILPLRSVDETGREAKGTVSVAADQVDQRSAILTPPSPSRLQPLVTAAPTAAGDPSPLPPLVPLGAVPLARPRFAASEVASSESVTDRPPPQPTSIPTINITIGRIDIRAVPAPAPSPTRRAAPPSPKISLQDYLNNRNGGGG